MNIMLFYKLLKNIIKQIQIFLSAIYQSEQDHRSPMETNIKYCSLIGLLLPV